MADYDGSELRGSEKLRVGGVGDASKKQYTIKALDSVTIDLMREAAQQDGMKISSWASMKLKDAAERALNNKSSSEEKIVKIESDLQKIIEFQIREELKWDAIEKKVGTISDSQLTIISKILTN